MFSLINKLIVKPLSFRSHVVIPKQFYTYSEDAPKWRATTILAVKKDNEICIIGDGQVSYGSTRVKTDGRKIRKLQNGAFCGFAGTHSI